MIKKVQRLARRTGFTLLCLLVLGTNSYVAAEGLSQTELDNINFGTVWYDKDSGTALTGCSETSDTSGSSSIDLASIASKYGLQSAIVEKSGGATVAAYQADKSPNTPASTMKLIIVDTLLRSGLDLDKTITIPSDIEYVNTNGQHEHIGSSISLGDALDLTFRESGNTSANVLMYAMGGPGKFTKQAGSFGYKDTNVVGYYSAANDGKNSSTIGDETDAMNHIFNSGGTGYTKAQNDLKFAAGTYDGGTNKTGDNIYGVNDDANKWAGTTTVAGNVGKFNVDGQDYFIGLYINASDSDPTAISNIKNGSAAIAAALSAQDTPSTSSTSSSGPTTLVGASPEDQVWNYFKSKSLSDAQVAGIMGNIEQESSFVPTKIQDPGGTSQNPADAGSSGWGLIQWTPGSKALDDAQAAGITGPIYELSTQLDLIWQVLHNNPVVTASFDLSHYQQITSETEAADYFEQQIEAAKDGGNLPQREQNATEILHKYSGTLASSTSSCGAVLSPDCQSANGVAKILCAAKQYDTVSYQESTAGGHQGGAAWHTSCPVIGPSCVLDCSGLVNIAVYDAYSVDLKEDTIAEAKDTQYWQPVSFSQLQPGDLIQPGSLNGNHVEIVDHIQGNTIYTFGSHDDARPQPNQVGPASFTKSSGDLYLHYVGTGV